MRAAKTLAIAIATALAGACMAAGTVQISAFPNVAVADGRTPITVTAEVRDQTGSYVPDGSEVVFESNLGAFRENILRTQNGFARAVLVAGSVPGIANVRASARRVSANAVLEIEFVKSREDLSSAKDYIEVTSPSKLVCSSDDRIIQAVEASGEASLRYRNIQIEASEIQLKVATYEVIARDARLEIGETHYAFESLYLKLNTKKGVGTSEHEAESVRFAYGDGYVMPEFVRRKRLGLLAISASGVTPYRGVVAPNQFEFAELDPTGSIIEARQATAFPGKSIQFHQANVRISGTSVMRVPLFQLPLNTGQRMISEQFLNVSNNQVLLNYPHYLSLKPGETSLLRFRYGNGYSTGAGGTGGAYLDYELRWNRGSDLDGGFTVHNIGRGDWGLSARQLWTVDSRTSMAAQIDIPGHRSLFGNASISRDFDGFQANLSTSASRRIQGAKYQTQSSQFIIEKHPTRLGKLPVRLFLGAQATQDSFRSEYGSSSGTRAGFRARLASDPIRFGRDMSLNFAYKLSQFSTSSNGSSLGHEGTLTLSSQLANGLFMMTSYDYVDDGISSQYLGRHRLTSEMYFGTGSVRARGYLSRSLDMDRMYASLGLDLRVTRDWRFYYTSSLDRYENDGFSNQSFILAYRLGMRELGLSYSTVTRRVGLEILGTTFD